MTDSTTVTSWMNDYLRAWDSNDPEHITAMFTEQAEYRDNPWDEPVTGHDAIVANWIGNGDEPEAYTFTWSESGIDGDVAFVEGETTYTADGRRYANLWVIRFAADGRAESFTEWYMKHPAAAE